MAAEAQGQLMAQNERDNDAADNFANTHLITGLGGDIILCKVVPLLYRLPWNERPLLRILNRSWNKAMTERFPIYHQRFHPNFVNNLSKALIISHLKQTNDPAVQKFSGVLLELWVCRPSNNNGSIGDDAITTRLPEHPFFQVEKPSCENYFATRIFCNNHLATRILCDNHLATRILCDNHRVFTLTESYVGNGNYDYSMWMLDLRDFNPYWKRLPPLPKLGNFVYASSSSLNGDCISYIWQHRRSDSSRADGWKLIPLNLLNCEWQWEYVNVNIPPPKNLLNFDPLLKRLPLYVQIERRVDYGRANHPHFVSVRDLYRRCSIPYYVLKESDFKSYVFILADGIITPGNIHECNLCFMTIKNNGICIVKVELDEERTRIVEEQEWDHFVLDWNREMRRRGYDEIQNTWPVRFRERSAMKVFRLPDPWTKLSLEVKQLWDGLKDEPLDNSSIISVVQQGPIYGYSWLGSKYDVIPLLP